MSVAPALMIRDVVALAAVRRAEQTDAKLDYHFIISTIDTAESSPEQLVVGAAACRPGALAQPAEAECAVRAGHVYTALVLLDEHAAVGTALAAVLRVVLPPVERFVHCLSSDYRT